MGVGVWGLGFGVWGLGLRVWGLGFGPCACILLGLHCTGQAPVLCDKFGVWGLGFGVWGLGFGVAASAIVVEVNEANDNVVVD